MALTGTRLLTTRTALSTSTFTNVTTFTATSTNLYVVISAFIGTDAGEATILASTSGTVTQVYNPIVAPPYLQVWLINGASGSTTISAKASNTNGSTAGNLPGFCLDEISGISSTTPVQSSFSSAQTNPLTITLSSFASASNVAYLIKATFSATNTAAATCTLPTGSTVIASVYPTPDAVAGVENYHWLYTTGFAPVNTPSNVFTTTGAITFYSSLSGAMELAVSGGGGGATASVLMMMGMG